jgi:hypothetical protein
MKKAWGKVIAIPRWSAYAEAVLDVVLRTCMLVWAEINPATLWLMRAVRCGVLASDLKQSEHVGRASIFQASVHVYFSLK